MEDCGLDSLFLYTPDSQRNNHAYDFPDRQDPEKFPIEDTNTETDLRCRFVVEGTDEEGGFRLFPEYKYPSNGKKATYDQQLMANSETDQRYSADVLRSLYPAEFIRLGIRYSWQYIK